MQMYIDRDKGGDVYKFLKVPVWYSVQVDMPKELIDATAILTERFNALNAFLATVYENRRSSALADPEVPDNIKEIINSCLVPVEARRGKKQKPQDTAADSSTPSPEASTSEA